MKSHNNTISDEKLNAYIDDELDFEEREQLFQALSENERLSQESQELRQVQYLLRHAYRNPPAPQPRGHRHHFQRYLQGLAAGLLLAVGAFSGWYSHDRLGPSLQLTSNSHDDGTLIRPVSQEQQPQQLVKGIILHINSADPGKFNLAMDKAETLLHHYRTEGVPFQLEIIANKSGINLLQSSSSPSPQRVTALLSEYNNVTLMACANALKQLKERGGKSDLIPGINTNHTAIEKIVDRLEQGWHYLKV